MNNPYKIADDSLISFSGGRTSAFMLYKIVQAHNGVIPNNVHVVFANTGKEMNETLDFVNDCQSKWDIDIKWIELDVDYSLPKEDRLFYKFVNYESASRNGEPFAKLIEHWNKDRKPRNKNLQYKKNGTWILPNPVARFCTDYLKIRALNWYAKSIGFEKYQTVLGLRYDEPRRVHRRKNSKYETKKKTSAMPMYDAKDSILDVQKFWEQSNFDLKLPIINGETPHGNCDLCFLKSHNKIVQLVKEKPSRAEWWSDIEKKSKNVFRRDRPSYLEYIETVDIQPSLPFDDDGMDCFCHD